MRERVNRYEIQRPVQYRFTSSDRLIMGSGQTINISRTGILFQTNQDLEVGRRIHLVIRMGTTTGDGFEVKLTLEGLTVRSEGGYVAVATKKHKLQPDG